MYRLFSVSASLLILIFSFISFFYYNDDFGWDIPYYTDLVLYGTFILVSLLLVKSQIRWQKLVMTNNLSGFKLTWAGWKKAFLNEFLPFFIYLPISVFILIYIPESLWIAIVLWIYVIEGLFHVVIGYKKYKLIINNQSILVLRNKQYIIFWDKIKTISFKYEGILILQSTGDQIYLSEVDFEDFDSWKEQIKSSALKKKIYINN